MPLYRFYFVASDGHVMGEPEAVDCFDDGDAVMKAHARLAEGWFAIDVWDLARRVARVEPGAAEASH